MSYKPISVPEALWKKGVALISKTKVKGESLTHAKIYEAGLLSFAKGEGK